MTPPQVEASAKAPCTRTTVGLAWRVSAGADTVWVAVRAREPTATAAMTARRVSESFLFISGLRGSGGCDVSTFPRGAVGRTREVTGAATGPRAPVGSLVRPGGGGVTLRP